MKKHVFPVAEYAVPGAVIWMSGGKVGLVMSRIDDKMIARVRSKDGVWTAPKTMSARINIARATLPAEDAAPYRAEIEGTPADPVALAQSVNELETWLDQKDGLVSEIDNEVSFGESIALVLHELQRLQARASAN